jgi:hypothetical protein
MNEAPSLIDSVAISILLSVSCCESLALEFACAFSQLELHGSNNTKNHPDLEFERKVAVPIWELRRSTFVSRFPTHPANS